VLRLPLHKSAKLIAKAIKNKQRDEEYVWWLARLPIYTADNFESFEEFRDKLHPKPIAYDQRSQEDIMADIVGRKEE
jgi:hypothetical protein